MGKSTKKSASKVAVAAPASSPDEPLKKGKREAEVIIENELVSSKKQKALKKGVESEQKPKDKAPPMIGKSDSESHSDISGVEEVAAKNVAAPPPPPSNGRSEEDVVVPAKKEKADSPEESSGEDEPAPKIPKTSETDATPEEQSTGSGSKTLLFKNMSYEAQKADVLEFFKPAGEVVDVRLAMKADDSFKGSGHVEFATAEQAQKALLELNDKESLERKVKLFLAREEKKVKCGKTLFVKNMSFQVQKADVLEFFKPAGEVVDIRLAMRECDSFKGYGHVDFATAEQAEKALLDLNGKKLLHRAVKLAREEKNGEESTDGKTLIAYNMPFQVQKADVLEFFKPAGEVVDVRLAMKEGDSFKGYGHVDFATAEQAEKALLELNGKELLQRRVKLIVAREPKKGEFRQPFERRPELEVFVTGFDAYVGEDNIRASLMDHFACCGEIARVSIPTGPHGKSVGIAYVQFLNENARSKALELGTETMMVEEPRPRAGFNNRPSKDTPRTGTNTATDGDD